MIERPSWGWRYLARFILGGIFVWASLAKIGDLAGFAADLHNYHLLPIAIENVLAMVIPWIELVAGLALILNLAPRGATWVLGFFLAVFLLAILSAIVRHLDIACGCFGTADATRTGWTALLRDVVFLLLAWLGYPRVEGAPASAPRHAEAV